MSKPLFLLRSENSPLVDSFGLGGGEKDVVLIQDGVRLSGLIEKGAKALRDDAEDRGTDTGETIDYDGLLDAVLESSVVITI